jgi:hypothetical protein
LNKGGAGGANPNCISAQIQNSECVTKRIFSYAVDRAVSHSCVKRYQFTFRYCLIFYFWGPLPLPSPPKSRASQCRCLSQPTFPPSETHDFTWYNQTTTSRLWLIRVAMFVLMSISGASQTNTSILLTTVASTL